MSATNPPNPSWYRRQAIGDMQIRRHQTTVSLNLSSVAMLCLATTMMLGFSKPEANTEARKLENSLQTVQKIALANPLSEPLSNPLAEPVSDPELGEISNELTRMAVTTPPLRPDNFSSERLLEPVLAVVNARAWIDASQYSNGAASEFMHGANRTTLHGVGYPDVRTFKRPRRSPFAEPLPWSSMIAWRKVDGAADPAQPIAKVRCMGLTPQAVARRAERYNAIIHESANEYGVNANLVKAVITEESCFNNQALSPVGAQGLMQLMPDTASWLNVRDPHDPLDNLKGGIKYLASLRDQFGSIELTLAAYNAGPGNVRRYGGIPPFAETQAYVQKVQSHLRRYNALSHFSDQQAVIAGNDVF